MLPSLGRHTGSFLQKQGQKHFKRGTSCCKSKKQAAADSARISVYPGQEMYNVRAICVSSDLLRHVNQSQLLTSGTKFVWRLCYCWLCRASQVAGERLVTFVHWQQNWLPSATQFPPRGLHRCCQGQNLGCTTFILLVMHKMERPQTDFENPG